MLELYKTDKDTVKKIDQKLVQPHPLKHEHFRTSVIFISEYILNIDTCTIVDDMYQIHGNWVRFYGGPNICVLELYPLSKSHTD